MSENVQHQTFASLAEASNFPLFVYIEAYATSLNFEGEEPQYVKVAINESFIDCLLELQAFCDFGKLSQARREQSPALWGPRPFEASVRLMMPELIVSGSDFWFSDHAKYGGSIESRNQSIPEFLRRVVGHTASEPCYFGNSELTQDLINLIEADRMEPLSM